MDTLTLILKINGFAIIVGNHIVVRIEIAITIIGTTIAMDTIIKTTRMSMMMANTLISKQILETNTQTIITKDMRGMKMTAVTTTTIAIKFVVTAKISIFVAIAK